ncbi:MAG TPA: alpha/beta hydrolase-fold protein [Holophagaceae bacterium]|jgi:homoserine O-acetyltransferase|nr:alpha/beta hydrolase-fold protein [Holophagaceae bacterium]
MLAAPVHARPAIPFRRHGHGPARVLLLHALTGSPDAADRADGDTTVKGWWSPLFEQEAPLAAEACTVWTPQLPDSEGVTARDLALSLAAWIEAEDLRFDLLAGGSLGGMVALELALQAPSRFASVAVIGCGGRSDAWVRGHVHAERRILEAPLPDKQAIALARHSAMLSFRAPRGLEARFSDGGIEAWLDHHGTALAARFTRARYHALLGAMASHDLGRDRGGLVAALKGLACPLHVLGIDTDSLFAPALIRELAEAARRAGRFGSLRWLNSPHGHDAFLLEWPQVAAWLDYLLALAPHAEIP